MTIAANLDEHVTCQNHFPAAAAAATLSATGATGVVRKILKLSGGFSTAPAAVTTLTVTTSTGTAIIFKRSFPAAVLSFDFDFPFGLTGNIAGDTLVATLSAPGGAVQADLNMEHA